MGDVRAACKRTERAGDGPTLASRTRPAQAWLTNKLGCIAHKPFHALALSPSALRAQAADPVAVLKASDAAYNAHDLEAISALFADDAVRRLIPPPSPEASGIWRGKQEIRAQWQREFALNARVERIGEYQSSGDQVTGRARYWDDALVQLGVAPIEYTIEVTVHDGTITASTITTSPESVAKIQEAISRLPATGAAPGPEAVVKALEAGANTHDVDGATALFTDDAVIQIRPEALGETITGKDAIRQWFTGLYADDFHITVNITNVQGDTVTTSSTIASNGLRALGLASLDGIERYTVQNGKITGFTFTYTNDAVARLQAALTPQTLPSTGTPAVPPTLWLLLLAGTGICLGASLRIITSLSARRCPTDAPRQG